MRQRFLKILCDQKFVTWFRDHVGLIGVVSNNKSAHCFVWCPSVLCKWRYNIFNFSCNLTRPPHWWGQKTVWVEAPDYNSPTYQVRYCDSGYKMLLFCHATLRDYVFKGFYKLMGGNLSVQVTTLPWLVVIFLVQVKI